MNLHLLVISLMLLLWLEKGIRPYLLAICLLQLALVVHHLLLQALELVEALYRSGSCQLLGLVLGILVGYF